MPNKFLKHKTFNKMQVVQNSQKDARGIVVAFNPIQIDGFNGDPEMENEIKNKSSLQLRQETITTYPSVRGGNDLSDALFEDEEFGPGKMYNGSRVTWVPVPKALTDADKEARIASVQQKLKAYPNARIYRFMSFDIMDVLHDDQKAWINKLPEAEAEAFIENKKEKLTVRIKNEQQELVPFMVDGKIVYAANFLSLQGRPDITKLGETKQNIQSFNLISETEKVEKATV